MSFLQLAVHYLIKGSSEISLDTLQKAVKTLPLRGGNEAMPTIAETFIAKVTQLEQEFLQRFLTTAKRLSLVS